MVDDWCADGCDEEEDTSCEKQEGSDVVEETHFDFFFLLSGFQIIIASWLLNTIFVILKCEAKALLSRLRCCGTEKES